MISPEGIVEYVVEVPPGGLTALPWTARLRSSKLGSVQRLVGPAPHLELEEFETVHAVPRTRVTVVGVSTVQGMSFCVDRALTRMLRPGDLLYVSRSGTAGIGLAVHRSGELVTAVGEVTAVPLGPDIAVRSPLELVREAEGVYRRRDSDYETLEYPVEVTSGGGTRLLHRARVRLGRYEVFVVHGSIPGTPGTAECVAISLIGVCPDSAAPLTARLLDAADATQVPQ